MNLCDNDVGGLQTVFTDKFEEIQRSGVNLSRAVWVLPRVETAAYFKRQWQLFHGGGVVFSPRIVTVDRISQPVSKRELLALQSQLVDLLAQKQWITKSSSLEQLWGLAGECLELAMRVALIEQAREQIDHYMAVSDHAQLEASIVLELAKVYHKELLALWARPLGATFSGAEQIVWFDDGEPLAGLWLTAFAPNLPIKQVKLPLVEGPEPWLALAANLATENRLSVSVAPDVATQARQAAFMVLKWLSEDAQSPIVIAVVDRLAARRLVPILAEFNVLVDDRTGWKFSTSRVAGWFMGLLETYIDQGELRLLPSPLLDGYQEEFQGWGVGASHMLSEWANHWLSLFNKTNVDDVLALDKAGSVLLRTLRDLTSAPSRLQVDCVAFAAAWTYQAEQARFKPIDVKSPVRLMPLLTTRLQDNKRVVVLGAAQSQFKPNPPGLLPPNVAAELGFPGPGLNRKQLMSALYELIDKGQKIAIFHAKTAAGKPEGLLPELQWLDIALRRQRGESADAELSGQLATYWTDSTLSVYPQEAETLELDNAYMQVTPPAKLSVTALDSWVTCRLQFGLKHALNLQQPKLNLEKTYCQLRGTYVHRVLELATQQVPRTAQADLDTWKQALSDAGSEVFHAFSSTEQVTIYPFYEYFQSLYPRVAGELIKRVQAGWMSQGVERRVEGDLALRSGKTIRFSGRIDKLERHGNDVAIIDIKYKDKKEVLKWAQNPEDFPQLAAYQQLVGDPEAKLAFFAIHKNGTGFVELPEPEDGEGWGVRLWNALSQEMDAFFNNASIWAPTVGDHCNRCDYAGVCRPLRAHSVSTESEGDNE